MAKREGPPPRGPKGGPPAGDAPERPEPAPGEQPPPPPRPPPPEPAPPLDESRGGEVPDDLTESSALVLMSASDVVRYESDEEVPAPPGPEELGESKSEPPPPGLTESSALVIMSDSDVVRLESDEEEAPAAPPAPPPAGAKKKAPPGPGGGAGPGGSPGSSRPRPGPRRAAPSAREAGLPPPPERHRRGPLLLGVALAIAFSAAGGYAVHVARERDREAERRALEREREDARERALRREAELEQAFAEERAARARELEAARRALEEERRAAAERLAALEVADRRREEDARRAEAALREALLAEREAAIRDAERRERERAERARLDLERRARETVERYEALIAEAESRRKAELEVARREARAEILRREALLHKQFDEEKAALERERESRLALETQKLEERLRAEYERERSGFIREPEGDAALEGEGIDLEEVVWKHLTGHLGGSVEYKLKAHFAHSDQPDSQRTRNEVVAKLRYEASTPEEHLSVKVLPRITADDDSLSHGSQEELDDEAIRRPIFTFEEATATVRLGRFEAAIGKQIFAIGTGDLVNPSDVLNPVDYTDLIDSEKIGVFALDASLWPLEDETRLRAFLIPTFTPSRLPLEGERFSPLPPEGIFVPGPLGPIGPIALNRRDMPEDPPDGLEGVQGGARASASTGGWDVAVTYFAGFNPIPQLEVAPLATPPFVELTPVFDRRHMLAFEFATTFGVPLLGEVQGHGEAAQFLTEGGRDDDYLQYVLGVNYTFADPLLAEEMTFILEYAGEWVNRKASDESVVSSAAFARAFESAILARLQWKPIDRLEVLATGVALLDGPDSYYLHPEARFEIGSHTRLEAGIDVLAGSKKSFFGQFSENDRFFLNLRLSF